MAHLLSENRGLYKERAGTYGLIEPLYGHWRLNLLYGVP
jgi:hypothetical protein